MGLNTLALHWQFKLLCFAPRPGTPKIEPKVAGIPSPAGGTLGFSWGVPTKWSPDRQAEVWDNFRHPQGVQVKALSFRSHFLALGYGR